MKIIFLLTLLVAAGAQDDSSGEDDGNMSTADDNMNSSEDDNMDSDENGSGGKSGKSIVGKKMIKKLLNMCVDVEFPGEMELLKACGKKEAQKSSFLEDILDGNFPDKQEWAKIFESFEMCKIKTMGINDIDTDYTGEKFPEFAKYDKWIGKEKVKEELKQKIISCIESAQGSGFEKMVSIYRCSIDYYLSKCTTEDEDPGMLLLFHLKVLTLFEDSKCAPVKVSDEMKQIVDECIEESKQVLKNSPQSSTTPSNKNTPKEMAKMMNLLNSFNKFGIQGLQQCMGNRTGSYDYNTNVINMSAFADTVKQFEGWEGIEQERDAVTQAIIECGREYEDSGEKDINSEDEKLKDLMQDNQDFENCFAPKFAQICGYNNELSSMFDFLLNPEFIDKLYAAFKEVAGKDVEDVINLLKAMLKKFKEQ